jgi:exodeoxyribonuclease VIII
VTEVLPIRPVVADNATPTAPAPGVHIMPMDQYHRSPGASKSQLDLLHQSPALVEWAKNAPEDPDADSAVDIGTALHALLLEPDQFSTLYVPDFEPPADALSTIADMKAALDARGIAYKSADSKAVLVDKLLGHDPSAPVVDALRGEWEKGIGARTVLSQTEHRKLILMRDSVMAHPTARKLLEAPGHRERCHFWIDELTGELCRCRIDAEIPKFATILDVKTTADIERFTRSVKQYRYHVQQSFYSEGYEATQSHPPAVFVFLVVSTTRDRKRYPTRLFNIAAADLDVAKLAIREDLATYAKCRETGVWHGIESLSLPAWA